MKHDRQDHRLDLERNSWSKVLGSRVKLFLDGVTFDGHGVRGPEMERGAFERGRVLSPESSGLLLRLVAPGCGRLLPAALHA